MRLIGEAVKGLCDHHRHHRHRISTPNKGMVENGRQGWENWERVIGPAAFNGRRTQKNNKNIKSKERPVLFVCVDFTCVCVCADYVSHVHRRTKVLPVLLLFCFSSSNNFWGCGKKKTNVKVKNPNEVIRFPLADLFFLLDDGIFVPHVDPRYLLITDAVNTPKSFKHTQLVRPVS